MRETTRRILLILGLSLASVVCAPCVPSTTAKCTILVPLAGMVGDAVETCYPERWLRQE